MYMCYKESITNEDYSYIIDKQTSTNEPPYFSSKGNSLQKSNPLLKNKRKRNDTIELNQKENKSNCININDIEIIKTINSDKMSLNLFFFLTIKE